MIETIACKRLIPSERAAIICPWGIAWSAPRKICDWYAEERNPRAMVAARNGATSIPNCEGPK